MKYTVSFKGLPFEPDKKQVIYVENQYDERINAIIREISFGSNDVIRSDVVRLPVKNSGVVRFCSIFSYTKDISSLHRGCKFTKKTHSRLIFSNNIFKVYPSSTILAKERACR